MYAPCPPPREPSRPVVDTPPNACDTHCHVFGPAVALPLCGRPQLHAAGCAAREIPRSCSTRSASTRGALVQGSAHGRDNSAMLDALEREPKRLRGVAVADADTPAAELRRWHALGVRGLRFNHFFRDGQLHYRGGVPLEAARMLAPVMRELGWHLQLWIDVKDLADTIPILQVDRPSGGDRSHGPHRRAAPARRRRASRACCACSAMAAAG